MLNGTLFMGRGIVVNGVRHQASRGRTGGTGRQKRSYG
jgi:hypothetical protein